MKIVKPKISAATDIRQRRRWIAARDSEIRGGILEQARTHQWVAAERN